MRIKLIFLIHILAVVFSACSTFESLGPHQSKVENISASLEEIRQAIGIQLSRHFSIIRKDGRYFKSNYYLRDENSIYNPETSTERLYSEFMILGDRRPFDMLVLVKSEKKVDGKFIELVDEVELTKSAAEELEKRIKNRFILNDTLEFRPF